MSLTTISILSPEAANGRNVVAYGVIRALASEKKTGVFRPAVCKKDTFTDVLLSAANAGIAREQAVGVCPRRAREDKEGSRADIVAAYQETVAAAAPEAMVVVGTDRSAVNDPDLFAFKRRCRRGSGLPRVPGRMRHRPHPGAGQGHRGRLHRRGAQGLHRGARRVRDRLPDENADEVKSALAGDVPV